jgi:hypothetical protein
MTRQLSRWTLAAVLVSLALTSSILAQEKRPAPTVTSLGPSGPLALRVNLVLLGDGYTQGDFGKGHAWETDSTRLLEKFFEKEPFASLRRFFNVHVVEVVSDEHGADDDDGAPRKKTAFGSRYGVAGIPRLLAPRDEKALRRAARAAPRANLILVLVNDDRYGGSGGKLEERTPLSICSKEETAYLSALHEFGHSFGGLGDEYADASVADKYPPLPERGDLPFPNLTLARLVDTTSRASLVKTLKWGRFFVNDDSFSSLGRGYYEGGYYRETGVYRPAETCIMQQETPAGGFCYVCADELRRRIYSHCGRNPRGGLPGPEVPSMGGALAAAHELYLDGKLARVTAEVGKIESSSEASAEDKANASILEKAVASSLASGLSRIDAFLAEGDCGAAHEYLALVEGAFEGTRWMQEIAARRKEWQEHYR